MHGSGGVYKDAVLQRRGARSVKAFVRFGIPLCSVQPCTGDIWGPIAPVMKKRKNLPRGIEYAVIFFPFLPSVGLGNPAVCASLATDGTDTESSALS